MGSIRISAFGGIKPNEKRGEGGPSRASVAIDSKIDRGTLNSWRYPAKEIETGLDKVCSIYNDDCCFVVSEKPCANFVKGDTNCGRVFSTGHMAWPAYANLPDCAKTCGEVPELTWCRLGVPAPTNAPTASGYTLTAPVANPFIDEGDQKKREMRSYMYTFVNEWGEESAPSPASAVFDADISSQATLAFSIPPLDEGYCDPLYIRIYRGGSGWNETGDVQTQIAEFFYIKDISFRTGNFTELDNVPASDLGETNGTAHYAPPLANLQNLAVTNEGVLVASEGKNLWFSEPWKFHAWACNMNLDDCIEGIVVAADTIYVATNGNPYAIDATNPKEDCLCCRQVNKIPTPAPLMCKRSMVATMNGAIWASTTGLVKLTGNTIQVDTHSHMTEDDWQEWFPHDIKGAFYKGAYYGFNSERGFRWDVNEGMYSDAYLGESGKFTELSFTPTAVWVTKHNIMYLAFDGALHRWDASDTKMPYKWRTKLNIEAGLRNFSIMKIVFERWMRGKQSPTPVHVRLIADDVVRFERTVRDSHPFRLPKGYDGLNWEIEVTGIEPISEIHMATSLNELTLMNNA